jgi:hypothetical protein
MRSAIVLALAVGLLVGSSLRAQAQPAAIAAADLAPGIRFEVTQLRRMQDKGVTELRFAVQNGSDSDATLKELGLAYHYNLQNIFLIDLGAKKQYDIGQAAKCLCSTFKDGDGGLVHAGERREFWAWYGLLPGSAKQMAIQLEGQPPLMNIPVE